MRSKTAERSAAKALPMSILCCALLGTACVNEIKSDIQPGSVPITFAAKVSEAETKADDGGFEEGDKAGLYAMVSGEGIDEQRYIDNLALICAGGNKLIPEKTVFYPEGDITLDFVSYYPYRKEAAAEGSPNISISVQTDQSNPDALSQSDFMTASCTGVASGPDAVELGYNHRLTKLKISLSPESTSDLDDMLESDPRIIATGFYTQADFDLRDNSISNFGEKADITAGGTWRKDGIKLSGKEFIVIPQTVGNGQKFQIEWDGRVYDCPMPDVEDSGGLQPNTQYELLINVDAAGGNILGGVVADVTEWEDEVVLDEVDGEAGNTALHLSVLSFGKSNIYRVHLGGTPVMDICKEYLLSGKMASAAITAYPLDKDGNPDLTDGTVLQICDEAEDTNGGKISWNTARNTFTYTEGSLPPVTEIYFDTDGNMHTEKPDSPTKVNVAAYTIRDVRGNGMQEYSVVKIGTQYWMRENLRATVYRDGSPIDMQSTLDGTPGCFHANSNDSYFYSGEVLLEPAPVAPDGWEIPSMDDWDALDNYTGGDVSMLKAGEWQPMDTSDPDLTVAGANNRTMFCIYPVGQWANNDDYNNHTNEGRAVGFWSWDKEKGEIPEETVFFIGEDNARVLSSTRRSSNRQHYKGLCIRCIRQTQ